MSNQVFLVPRTQKDNNPNGNLTVQYRAQVASGPQADHRKREEGRERLEGRRAQLLVAGWPEAMPAWSSLPTTCSPNTQPLSNITTTTTTTSTTLTHLFDISFLLVLTAAHFYTLGLGQTHTESL